MADAALPAVREVLGLRAPPAVTPSRCRAARRTAVKRD